jgi:hypothetical protein
MLNRTGRELTRVEHRARVETHDLDRFFFDIGASVQMTRGDGWSELTIYPGASTRASRQQRELVQKGLQEYAAHAVRYFGAVRRLYSYMDMNPHRTEELFVAVFAEGEDAPQLSEDEQELVDRLKKAANVLLEGGQEQNETNRDRGRDFARDADSIRFRRASP